MLGIDVLCIQAPRECIYRAQNMGFPRIWIFVDYLAFIFTASQLWINANGQLPRGFEIHVRTPITVQRGLCVHIPCTFTVPMEIRLSAHANGFWHRLSRQRRLTLVASRKNGNNYTNGRVHLIGNVTRGDCSYYIEEPLGIDQSLYAFRMEDIQTKFTYLNIFPRVIVTEFTEKPTISSTRLQDGKEVTLTCTSPGKCRNITPRISWEEGTLTDVRQNIFNVTNEDGSRTFHSNITFTPRKSHNKSPLLCRVTLKDNLTTWVKQTLNVEYSPSMDFIIEGVDTDDSPTVIVQDGDSITLTCIVDSNPSSSVSLYKDGSVIYQNISHQTVTHKLLNITLSDTGRFQCSAVNGHGVTHRTVDIIFHNSTICTRLLPRIHLSVRMRHIKPSSLGVSLVVILPLLWKGITSQDIYTPGYSIQVSSRVSVQEGLCVTIPCTFTADYRNTFSNSTVYWIWMPSELLEGYTAATNDKSSRGEKTNFHLTGNPDTGDCTLTITDARKEDEGRYFYGFTESEDIDIDVIYFYNRETTTTITVPDLTEEPVISDLGTLTAGKEKTVTCSPPGNCSKSSLVFQWKKSDVSGIWKNSSTVTFTPSLDDHQKTITCEMTNSKGKTTQKTIVLDVWYGGMDSTIIIGMVIGNIVLILIIVGSYFCLKRRMEKTTGN